MTVHIPVLLQETINGLDIKEGSSYLDGTLGGAGHALYALEKGAKTIIGLDRDGQALEKAEQRLLQKITFKEENKKPKIIVENANFKDMKEVLDKHGIQGVDAILIDLGFSSDQMDNSGRGFSFQKDEPLLMTLGLNDVNAYDVVNTWSEDTLFSIIKGFGEDSKAWKIAKLIVEEREEKPIQTTHDLVRIIKRVYPKAYYKINPATKTFQAIRIAVNAELDSLKKGLISGKNSLNKGGKMAIISFHSLEDRIVKNFIKEDSELLNLTKKPIVASDEERVRNPRSRSAKLRIFQKI